MKPLRILITNIILKGRSGTEIVTMEMAQGLARRGHDVAVYSPDQGDSAALLRAQGITVTDRLDDLCFEPDVVHGNQSVELVQALVAFPRAPGVFVCHGSEHWFCSPPDITRIRAFVAVDRLCLERIAREVPRVCGSARIVHNAVDLSRFARRDALPERPRRALVLCKHASSIAPIEAACRQSGLDAEVLGVGAGAVVDDLPARFRAADIVFACARTALEAMAVGCAVVVVDYGGLAGLVTDDVVAAWRDDNFGKRLLSGTHVSVPALVDAIARYDAGVSARVCEAIRAHHDLDRAVSIYEEVYAQAIEANKKPDPALDAREISRLMRLWLPTIAGVSGVLVEQLRTSEADRADRLAQVRLLTAQVEEIEADRAARLMQIHELTARLVESESDRAARREQILLLTSRLEKTEADRAACMDQVRTLAGRVSRLPQVARAFATRLKTLFRRHKTANPGGVAGDD